MKQNNKISNNSWPPGCYVHPSVKNGKMRYNGKYSQDGILFSFWCVEQESEKNRLRGKLRIISQETGFTLNTQDRPPKKVECSFYLNPNDLNDSSSWESELMSKIEHVAMKLIHQHMLTVKRDAELLVTPEIVSPQMAVLLYSDKFFRDRHRRAGEKLITQHRHTLQSFFSHIPNKPMSAFVTKEMRPFIENSTLSKKEKRLVWSFWDYCSSSGLCSGTNPIQQPLSERQSAAAKQAKADRLDVLDLATQLALYRFLLANSDARACGIALILWGGLSAAEACKLRWRDLLFFGSDRVAVKLKKQQMAGATHDYSRVLFIQAVRILMLHYEHLSRKYSHKQILDLPIVSSSHDAKRFLKPNMLNQFGRELLKRCGVDEQILRASEEWHSAVATRVFINTYASNLIHYCGLTADDGTYLYMTGRSLRGNVTQDHYNSHSCDYGLAHQFSVIRRMAPEEAIPSVPVDTTHPDYDVYTLTPPTTLDHLYFSVSIPGVCDGQAVHLLNEYGLILDVSASCDNKE